MTFFKTFIASTLILLIVSCLPTKLNTKAEPQKDVLLENVSILALGDSYTIGEGVKPNERWPEQITNHPEITKKISLTTIAKTGWTTGNLLQAIETSKLQSKYDLVFLLIGVNNQFQGLSIDTYREEFKRLIDIALNKVSNQSHRVIVLSIPDWGVTPFALSFNPEKISADISNFNKVNKEEALNENLVYIDITPISKDAKNQPDLLAEDKLHPSGSMYKLWASKVIETLKPLKLL